MSRCSLRRRKPSWLTTSFMRTGGADPNGRFQFIQPAGRRIPRRRGRVVRAGRRMGPRISAAGPAGGETIHAQRRSDAHDRAAVRGVSMSMKDVVDSACASLAVASRLPREFAARRRRQPPDAAKPSSAYRQNLRPHSRRRHGKAAAARDGDADGAAIENDSHCRNRQRRALRIFRVCRRADTACARAKTATSSMSPRIRFPSESAWSSRSRRADRGSDRFHAAARQRHHRTHHRRVRRAAWRTSWCRRSATSSGRAGSVS